MSTASEVRAAAEEVERAIERWVQARSALDDEAGGDERVKTGIVATTAVVWGAECASLNTELDGYSIRWVGSPRGQGVSASAGLGAYIQAQYT